MFGSIGPQEILIVLVIALIVLGPKKLPEMARSLGKGVKEFKEGINDDDTVDVAADEEDEDEPVSSRVHELPPADLPPADGGARAGRRSQSPQSHRRLVRQDPPRTPPRRPRDRPPSRGWRASAGSTTARRPRSSSI